jgi:hypothetical protein
LIDNPSWQHFATHDESEYPELWRGVRGYWAPCLGPSGTRLHDVSGLNNWGTLTNMDAATDWVVDSGRYALDFDGSNDYVSAGNSMAGRSVPRMTVSCWVLIRSSYGMAINCNWTNGFVWYIAPSSSAQSLFIGSTSLTSIAVPNQFNVWRHYWFSFDNGITRAGYDGIQSGSVTYGNTPSFATAWSNAPRDNLRINIGGYGRMDDVIWWDRVLNTNEIRELYQIGRGGMLTPRRRRRAYSVATGLRRRLLLTGQV